VAVLGVQNWAGVSRGKRAGCDRLMCGRCYLGWSYLGRSDADSRWGESLMLDAASGSALETPVSD
jgi:hypothetical protein